MTILTTEFYIRQASIPNIGPNGLSKLRSSTVAIAGVGGVGSSAAYYLARSGVGNIRLIDQDIIEPSNLPRVHSATSDDLYHPKAETIAQKLTKFDNSTKVFPFVDTITDRNVDELLDGIDLVVDGLDNFRTRYVLNRFSLRNEVPYVFVSAVAEQAHIALLNPPKTPCLGCFMSSVSDSFADSCETLGVSPIITGLAGAIGAETVIQFLVSGTGRLTRELLTVDLTSPEFLFSNLQKQESCTVCGNSTKSVEYSDSHVRLLCGEHTANILPNELMHLKLSQARCYIPSDAVLAGSESFLVYREGPHIITLFDNGRLLIGQIGDETEAQEIAARIWRKLMDSPISNQK